MLRSLQRLPALASVFFHTQQGDEAMSNHSRRAVLAGIATVALAAPALALTAGAADPIFAAIKRHRAAAVALTAKVDEQAELEIADVPEDAPRWLDFERRYEVTHDELEEASQQLFDAPMSIAGLVVLFEYMEEQRRRGNGDWNDAWSLPTSDKMLTALVGMRQRLGAVS
jgi:hypothetical protein